MVEPQKTSGMTLQMEKQSQTASSVEIPVLSITGQKASPVATMR